MKKFTLIALLLFSSSACAQSIELYLGKGGYGCRGKGCALKGRPCPALAFPHLTSISHPRPCQAYGPYRQKVASLLSLFKNHR